MIDDYSKFKITYSNSHLYICNYKAIIDISDKEIIIKESDNIIRVYGNDIVAIKIVNNEALFEGSFKRIDLYE